MKYRKLSPKHKKLFVIHKINIVLGILIAISLALVYKNIELPSVESKMSVSGGFIILSLIGALALFNRVRSWLKLRSGKFVVAFVLMFIIKYIIDTAIWGVGLVLIPLLIDDVIINPYWKVVWEDEYET